MEIRVHDPENQPAHLEKEICERYKLRAVRVVKVPLNSREDEWLARDGGVRGEPPERVDPLGHDRGGWRGATRWTRCRGG